MGLWPVDSGSLYGCDSASFDMWSPSSFANFLLFLLFLFGSCGLCFKSKSVGGDVTHCVCDAVESAASELSLTLDSVGGGCDSASVAVTVTLHHSRCG